LVPPSADGAGERQFCGAVHGEGHILMTTRGAMSPQVTTANNALAASAAVPDGVEATADHGNLTLTGAVKYLSQRADAESAVSGLAGVRNVKDEIQLVFDVDSADVNRLVTEALDSHRVPPDDSRVVARASGNTVMLGGRVRTRAQRDAVVAAAWQGHAVMAVIDELEITG
jgi:osmotically-inducible protein OsmY